MINEHTEHGQIWVIRLVNNGLRHLTSYKKKGLTWGGYKNAMKFKSKYECKQIYNQINEVALCEMHKRV